MTRRPLTYGSLCTGLGGETVAWHPLGWRAAWFAEIDPFCCAVLAHHYPEVKNLGDVTLLDSVPPVDVIVGGTPCQSFSVNGARGGLGDPRGALTLHFFRLVARAQPRWVVWENVPGVLSSAGGRDFAAVLGMLEDGGYGWAWRVVDLRSFGVPQRRRRLWLVGHRRDMRPAAAVLLARAGVAEAAGQDGKGRRARAAGNRGLGWGYLICGDATPKVSSPWAPTLRSQQGGEGVVLWTAAGPRRLTPLEWERLQGFPDGHTLVPFRGRPAPDGRRRRALGNAFAPPYLRWIGGRIERWERGE